MSLHRPLGLFINPLFDYQKMRASEGPPLRALKQPQTYFFASNWSHTPAHLRACTWPDRPTLRKLAQYPGPPSLKRHVASLTCQRLQSSLCVI